MNLIEIIKSWFKNKSQNADNLTEEQQKVKNFVENVRENYKDLIKEVVQEDDPNISSFNFTKSAFYDKAWNDVTCKARGLFIDTKNWKVVARGFDKFFNIDEVPQTDHKTILQNFMTGTIKAYVKYNGYLGIYSYDADTGCSYFCQKSRLTRGWTDNDINKNDPAWYAKNFGKIFSQSITEKQFQGIREFCRVNNCSAIFEVIDNVDDPHIINYKNKGIVLLAYVKNSLNYEELEIPESHIINLNENGIITARCVREFKWYDNINFKDDIFTIPGFSDRTTNIFSKREFIEGIVLVDENYNRVKIKTEYYNFWKNIRSIWMRYNKFMADVISNNNPYSYDELLKLIRDKNFHVIDEMFNRLPNYYKNYKYKNHIISIIKRELTSLISSNLSKFNFIRYVASSEIYNSFINFKNHIIMQMPELDKHIYDDTRVNDYIESTYDDYILTRSAKYLVDKWKESQK